MTVEDRLRATTQAVTAAMSPVRPLDLSGDVSPSPVHDLRSLDLLDASPPHARRIHDARRWLSWGAPIAAAALVTAVALILVMLRQVPAPQTGPAPAARSTAAPAAAFPRYYVFLRAADPSLKTPMEAEVADAVTGAPVTAFAAFPGQVFSGATAAADDRTFVVSSYLAARKSTALYLLRIILSAPHHAQLTKLPIKPLPAGITGLALSPDGRELAVMWRSSSIASKARTELLTYSLSSGAELGAWDTNDANQGVAKGGNAEGLSWVDGDRSVAFRWASPVGVPKTGALQIRTVDVTAAGHDLLADSRPVLAVPFDLERGSVASPCSTSLVASDGRTVVCSSAASGPSVACPGGAPTFTSYSTAIGIPSQVLYRYQGPCEDSESAVVWTDPSGSRVIGSILVKEYLQGWITQFGVMAGGHLAGIDTQGTDDYPGEIAY